MKAQNLAMLLGGLIGLSSITSSLYANPSDKVEKSSETLTEDDKEMEEAYKLYVEDEKKAYEEYKKNGQLLPPFIKTNKKDDMIDDQIDVMDKEINEDEKLEQSQIKDLERQKKEFDESGYFEINPTNHWGGYSDNEQEITFGMATHVYELIESSKPISRAEYCTFGKKWQGIYETYGLKIGLNEDMSSKWGVDLSKFKGIEFWARGTGKIRLQMTEGYMRFVMPVYGMAGFEDFFGEIYEKIIIPKPRWTHYQIAFDEFTRRKDYQHNLQKTVCTDEKKFDNIFDRSETHSTEIEFLPRGNPKEKKYVDFKEMRFYKK